MTQTITTLARLFLIALALAGCASTNRRTTTHTVTKTTVIINGEDSKGRTPLMRAAANCKAQEVKLLLDSGAKVDETDADGSTALALACDAPCTDIETIRLLIKAKADVNIAAKNGATPLANAILRNKEDTALLLIEAGSSIHSKDKWGYEVISIAVNKHSNSVVKALLDRGADPDYLQPRTTWPLIMEPIIAKKPELLKLILDAGANVRIRDANRMTPLMYARTETIVAMLLAAGVEVDAIDSFGFHALHYIASNGEKKAIELVAKASTTVNYAEAENKGVTVIAVFAKPRAEVASYFAGQAAVYFPAVIEYLGLTAADVFGKDAPEARIALACSEESGSAFWSPGMIVLYSKHTNNPKIKENNVGVVYHELGHYFFRGGDEIAWFIEGVNSYLPIAAAEIGLLDPAEVPVAGVRGIWNIGSVKTDGDRPCIEDYRSANYSYFYSKSFKIQHIIFRELGSAKYRAFVRDVLHEVFANPGTSGEDCKKIIALLEKQRAIDWKELLAGWVFPGAYVKYSPADFGDKNKNKIIDIDETPAKI